MRQYQRNLLALLTILLGALLLLTPLPAQQDSDVMQGQTEHFHWQAPRASIARTRPLTETVEKELVAIQKWLGFDSAEHGQLIWLENKEELQALLDFPVPSWFAAVTQPQQNRILMVVGASAGQEQLHKTLRHELVHWGMQSVGEQGWAALPAWAHEGIAELWAGQRQLSGMEVSLAWPAFRNELPHLGDFATGFGREPYRAAQGYALAHAFFSRLQRKYGKDIVAQLLAELQKGTRFDRALIQVTGLSLVEHENQLREELGSLSRLLADFYPQFFLVITLLLLVGFPFAMRRRKLRHQAFAEKWAQEGEFLHLKGEGTEDNPHLSK